MMKAIKFTTLFTLVTVFFLIGCSSNKTTKSDRQPTALAVTLLKTSLAATVQKVTLEVVQNDQIIQRDTTAVADGHFGFPSFDLDAGIATFTVNGLDSQNHVVYSGQTTVTIEPGRDNTVSLQLLPAVPMVKLSPYWSQTQTGAPFVSRLELYNIAKFRSGDFQITFDSTAIRFDSIRPSSNAWGELVDTTTVLRTQLLVAVSRQGNDDIAPSNSPALVDLWFTALIAGATDLALSTDRMVDNVGTIAELGSSSFVADGQTISIQQVSEYGTIMGSVSNALDGNPLDSVDVTVTGPAQRSVKTNSDGTFSMAELPYGAYQVVASKTGFNQGPPRTVLLSQPMVSLNFVLTPVLDFNQYRAVLTWGAEPHDLDLHLWTLGTEIYFSHTGSLDTIPYAFLDVDNVSGYGPETITIDTLLDTCKFSVHNYSRSPDITVSRAHIDFYKGSSLIRSFDVPTTGVGLWWYAFDLTPTGSIIERNTIIDYNPGSGQSSPQQAKPTPR
jgi:uncharacterized protein YcfL